jgi:hypothetical protein
MGRSRPPSTRKAVDADSPPRRHRFHDTGVGHAGRQAPEQVQCTALAADPALAEIALERRDQHVPVFEIMRPDAG